MHYETYETSSAQKRIFLTNEMLEVNVVYNMPFFQIVRGKLEVACLKHALTELMKRHEGLRTSFVKSEGEVLQRVYDTLPIPIKITDGHGVDKNDIIKQFFQPFIMSEAPLWRVELARLGEEEHLLLFDIHHILADAGSIGLIFQELIELYNGKQLHPLQQQYIDYTIWHNDQLQSDRIVKQEQYWLNEFADEIPKLDLPSDVKTERSNYEGGYVSLELSSQLSSQLHQLCSRYHVTMFMVIFSAYSILLSKYTGKEDIVIGFPIAGRTHPEFESIVGMFVNTLALRVKPGGQESYFEYLTETSKKIISAFENQDYPFEMLVEKLNPEREHGKNPLFDACISLDNYQSSAIQVNNIEFLPYQYERKTSKFDLCLFVNNMEGDISFNLEYKVSMFTRKFAEQFLCHLRNILECIVMDSELLLEDIDILSEQERNDLLFRFNDVWKPYNGEQRIHLYVERQAQQNPDLVAVVFETESITYGELNKRANQLAHTLIEKNIGNKGVIGALSVATIPYIISILAILKSDNAYLPIDVSNPPERVLYLLNDSHSKLCLASEQELKRFKEWEASTEERAATTFLCMEDEELYRGDAGNPNLDGKNSDIMCIIYTSGSTGQPKGTMIDHKAVARVTVDPGPFAILPEDNILQTVSIAFDVCIYEIWSTLIGGATLCLIKKEDLVIAERLREKLVQYGITKSWFTSPLLNKLVDENPKIFKGLPLILSGGDVLSPRHINILRAANPDVCVINAYGPTENTIYTTFHVVEQDYYDNIPIGKPVRNTQIYIVNRWNQLQPIGVPGELCVGGSGLAKGYLNMTKMTAKKFVSNPFVAGERMYRTGDMARWLRDGTIEFLGRTDNQVKIRGYRIETGEVANYISNVSDVKESYVMAKLSKDGTKYLCAYVILTEDTSIAKIKVQLAMLLPHYMIPDYFVIMDEFPLNPNGKVDWRSLPEPDLYMRREAALVAPCNDMEKILAEIWSQLLNMKEVSVEDSFFALGGHSLIAIKMVTMINEQLKIDIPLNKIFSLPTIRQLAEYLSVSEERSNTNKAENVILLKSGRQKDKHIFLFHDGGGDISCYLDMVKLLNDDWSYWGIKMEEPEALYSTGSLEELGKRYLDQIRMIQPEGPYSLLGWSYGGIVAYEMACQLEETGEHISLLSMLDVQPRVEADHKSDWAEEIEIIKSSGGSGERWKNEVSPQMFMLIPDAESLTNDEIIERLTLLNYLSKLREDYIPGSFINVEVHLFISNGSQARIGNKWQEYCQGNLITYNVSGDHYSMLTVPNLNRIATILNELI